MLMVFAFSALMYAVTKTKTDREHKGWKVRVEELEKELATCKEVYKAVEKCAASTSEIITWKEIAEQCVDEKVQIKAR